KDVSFRIAPITDQDARAMITSLRSYPLLQGVRGESPIDIAPIQENLLRLSQLAVDFPLIKELDINPMMLSANEDSCKIVDARIIVEVS
ncbi:MAG: GNAT family acetyltransferase, partial [Methanobacteriota archaeon]